MSSRVLNFVAETDENFLWSHLDRAAGRRDLGLVVHLTGLIVIHRGGWGPLPDVITW